LVSGYYAARVTLELPKYRHILSAPDEEQPTSPVGRLILEHHHGFLALIILTLATTLTAI
jgi:hypothetical protein